jgi:hypothetical protein
MRRVGRLRIWRPFLNGVNFRCLREIIKEAIMDKVQECSCTMAALYLLKKRLERELRRRKLVLWVLGIAGLVSFGMIMFELGR